MNTRRGFLKLLGLAAPAAALGLAVLPTEGVGYRMFHKEIIRNKNWMNLPIDYDSVVPTIGEYAGWIQSK